MRALTVFLLAVLSGCATNTGVMPAAPADKDLVCDGSPAAQQEMVNRYGVTVQRSAIPGLTRVRVGEASRALVVMSLTDSEVSGYLASDPKAAAQLPSVPRQVATTLAPNVIWVVGAPAVAAFFGGMWLTIPGTYGAPGQYTALSNVAFVFIVLGVAGIFATALLLLPILLVTLALQLLDDAARMRAIETFNTHLSDRIQTHAGSVAPATAAGDGK
jgi:hypothetical protein